MASVPPPYPPYGPDPRVLKHQRRMMRDQARMQRERLRFQSRVMRRGSLLGPVLAISVGVVFLLVETGRLAGNRVWDWYGRWWPLLLVLAGGVLLMEWAIDRFIPRPGGRPYVHRSASGAITLLLLFAVAGAALHQTRDFHNFVVDGLSINPDNVAEFFGSRHESDENMELAVPTHGTLTIDVPHGDIAVTGTSTDGQVHLAVHKQVYANSDEAAEVEARDISPQVAKTGASVSITIPSRGGASVDLTLTVPSSTVLALNANHGDIRVDSLAAPLAVTANHGDIALSSINGAVVSHLNNNGSSFSAHQVTGAVTLDGHADDLTLSDIAGAVTMTGDFYGDIHLEHIAGAIHFHTSRTDLQLGRLDGQVEMSSEEISADQLAGPVVLTTRNRNLRLERVAGNLTVANRNGTVDISAASPLGNITIQNRDGAVSLSLPDNPGFSLDATTEDGSIENDFSLGTLDHEHRSVINGTVGKGGAIIRIDNNHGDIAVHKAEIGPLIPIPPPPPAPPVRTDPASSRTKNVSRVSTGTGGVHIVSGENGDKVSIGRDGVSITTALDR